MTPRHVPSAARGGFSLIEVIVALMVAGILCASFLGSQRQNIFFIEHAGLNWEQINYSQLLLAQEKFADLSPSVGWVEDPEDERLKWKVEKQVTADGTVTRLITSVDGAKADWKWVEK